MVGSMTVQEFHIVVAGEAKGKDRPLFNRKTGVAYTKAGTVTAEREIRQAWRECGEPRMPDDVALEVVINVFVTRPKGHFKKNVELSTEGLRHPIPRNRKPDLDNVCKLVLDALNKQAYRDDVLIAKITVQRFWDDWPSTSIKVSVLDASSE
jgi:Holliday junction resolvase RusA-like endonuclease